VEFYTEKYYKLLITKTPVCIKSLIDILLLNKCTVKVKMNHKYKTKMFKKLLSYAKQNERKRKAIFNKY